MNDRIQALSTKAYVVRRQGGPFILEDVVLDEIRGDEVLVEVKYTGLCHTDIVVQHGGMPGGQFPTILGHEGVGIVRQMGADVADKTLSVGDTVALVFHTCGQCSFCSEGKPGGCVHFTATNFIETARAQEESPASLHDGTPVHAQFFGQSSLSKMAVVTEKSAIKIDVKLEELKYMPPLSCGYFTGAGTVLNVLQLKPQDKFVILGMGAVGLAALMAARAVGCSQVVAVDIVDAKLEKASELGCTSILNTKDVRDLYTGIRNIFPEGADAILDTTGVISLLESSFKALCHGGTLALVGVPPASADVSFNALDLLTSCKRVIGVIEGLSDPRKLVPQLIQLYHEGKFPMDKIPTVYPADQLDKALDDLQSGKVIKPILSWESVPLPAGLA